MYLTQVNSNSNLAFKRLLKPIEKIENRAQSDDAKKAIGLEHLFLVTHTPSFPSSSDEDTGIGVLSLNKGTLSYINFAYDNAIDGISIEPPGIIKGEAFSPYDGSVLSKKPIVDIKALTQDKWANILSESTFNSIVQDKDYKVTVPIYREGEKIGEKDVVFDTNRVIYDYALSAHKRALREAYENFKIKLENHDPRAIELQEEFMEFQNNNNYYLEGDAVYSVLSDIYENDYYPNWPSVLHQTLFDNGDSTYTQKEKQDEILKLKKQNKEAVDFYKFSQFVVSKQQKEVTDYAARIGQIRYDQDMRVIVKALKDGAISAQKYEYLKNKTEEFRKTAKGVNFIGDKQIGYSSMDIWSNPSIFTKDEFMGAPPNLIKESLGQDWNFRFIPRELLFNEDDSLGEGGQYLKKTIKKAFRDNPGGIRIDHILGMIDPWTYKPSDEKIITPIKFSTLLLTSLKDLRTLGINQDTIEGLKDPLNAIQDPNSKERRILEQRGVEDFDKANEIIAENQEFVEKMKHSDACTGSRYIFKLLLNDKLKDLRPLGFNEEIIMGIIDPIRGILDEKSNDRKILSQRGIQDFAKAADIILKNQEEIKKEYSKIIEKILFEAGKEVITERSNNLGLNLSDDEIMDKTRSLLICEDLGALTLPLKWVMSDLGLTGMRMAQYSDPDNPNHIYREGNPREQGNYWLIGSHDSPPYASLVNKFNEQMRNAHALYISEELGIDKEPLLDKKNPHIMTRAKTARMFAADKDPSTPNNVLLNWLDLFASPVPYNKPGYIDKENNWNLRVAKSGDSFERKYYNEIIPSKKGVSIPEVLSMALEACGFSKSEAKLNEGLKKTAAIMEEKE